MDEENFDPDEENFDPAKEYPPIDWPRLALALGAAIIIPTVAVVTA